MNTGFHRARKLIGLRPMSDGGGHGEHGEKEKAEGGNWKVETLTLMEYEYRIPQGKKLEIGKIDE